jgi:putative ATP-dependent endonuclease of OLD family
LVPVGGKRELLRPAIIARHMEIPLFIVFDADGDKIEVDAHRKLQKRDSRSLLRFLNTDESKLFPHEPIWAQDHAVWPTDLSDCIDLALKTSLGVNGFETVNNKAQARCGLRWWWQKVHDDDRDEASVRA